MSKSRPDEATEREYLIQELVCNYRDSVVTITGQYSSKEIIGNGFFIMGHYIICPAKLVLIPPTSDTMTKVDRILVSISNVNGCGASYCYQANILGVDGKNNIAILYIDMDLQWNLFNPHLTSEHPYLNWGKSRNSCPGDTVVIIGEVSGLDKHGLSGVAENGVSIGNIADNRYVSYNGTVSGELLLLSNMIPNGKQCGMPIINTLGKVIGMFLHSEGTSGMNIALAEFFMRRPVRALIRNFIDNKASNPFIESNDGYYRYSKSKLGYNGVLMSHSDYTPETQCKDIVGYRITKIPENSTIEVGDIITHVNNCLLGDRKGQISPDLVMLRVPPGDVVIIKYRTRSSYYNDYKEIMMTTSGYNYYLDYPWYAITESDENSVLM